MEKKQRRYTLAKKQLKNQNKTIQKLEKFNVGFTLLFDVIFFLFAWALTIIIEYRGNFKIPFSYSLFPVFVCATLVINLIFLVLFDCYKVLWKYAGANDFLRMVSAFAVSLTLIIILKVTFFKQIDLAVLVLFMMLFFIAIGTIRFNKRLRYTMGHFINARTINPHKKLIRVLVYGAGYTGAALISRFIANPSDGLMPVGIIDDDPEKTGAKVNGIRIYGGRNDLAEIIPKIKAEMLIIAITNLTKKQLRTIYAECSQYGIPIKIVPTIAAANNFLDSDSVTLRSIRIEDLLGRTEHKLDIGLVNSFIKDKIVMVTGGCGSIGSELCRQALDYGCKHLVIYDWHENGMFEINEEFYKKYDTTRYSLVMGSVRDTQKLEETFNEFHPEVVFHAAAYKHVPMMEISGDEAVKNNVMGTWNVVRQCDKSGVGKFVMISTDKAVNPANIMGATKRIAELIVEMYSKKSNTVMAAVRFGNVLGSNGSVIPTFLKQINAGGPVTLTHREMQRYFMTIPEAVRLVLQAGALAKGGEVFVLDMGEPVFIRDLAADLIRMSGLVPNKDIEIKETGLRPGEKLFEELRFSNEDVDSTSHEGIFITKLADVDEENLEKELARLTKAAIAGEVDKVENIIFEIVPSAYRVKMVPKKQISYQQTDLKSDIKKEDII